MAQKTTIKRYLAAAVAAIGFAVCGAGYYFSNRHAEAKATPVAAVDGQENPFSADDVRRAFRDFVREANYQIQNPLEPTPLELVEADVNRLRGAIDTELERREQAIEQMADELYARSGCHTDWHVGFHTSLEKYALYSKALELDAALHPSMFSPYEARDSLQQILDDIINMPTNADPIRANRLPYLLASSRKAERCLGRDGDGLFDLYRDYVRTFEEGDCDNARNLAIGADDAYRRLRVTHSCIPQGATLYNSEVIIATLRENFFQEVSTIPEEEIPLSAQLAQYEEHAGWVAACVANRSSREPRESMQLARCLTDLYMHSTPTSESTGISATRLREVVDALPADADQRCYLGIMLGERQRSDCRDDP
ncbi:hypothetical protein HYU22_03330 [Candidatus Woesearchaeota archaeon]|nr:hypothetical protein [Candidatus Woesearchaeota archaeon]